MVPINREVFLKVALYVENENLFNEHMTLLEENQPVFAEYLNEIHKVNPKAAEWALITYLIIDEALDESIQDTF